MKQKRSILLIANQNCSQLKLFANCLEADFLSMPDLPSVSQSSEGDDWYWSQTLQQWREKNCGGKAYSKIVVAIWQETLEAASLVDTNFDNWIQRCEAPLAWWAAALGCAQALCTDDGAVVAVIEQPTVLDAQNWTAEVSVAEAAAALIKSLARSDGGRGARFNAVTTPVRISADKILVDPQPPLMSFPGTIENEVIGAVRLLLDDSASGLTGRVLNVDCGRSL